MKQPLEARCWRCMHHKPLPYLKAVMRLGGNYSSVCYFVCAECFASRNRQRPEVLLAFTYETAVYSKEVARRMAAQLRSGGAAGALNVAMPAYRDVAILLPEDELNS